MGLFDKSLERKPYKYSRLREVPSSSTSLSEPCDSLPSLHPPGNHNPPRFHQTDANVTTYGSHLMPHRSTYDPHRSMPVDLEFEGGTSGTKLKYKGFEGSRETYAAGRIFDKVIEQEALARELGTQERLDAEFEKGKAEERRIRARAEREKRQEETAKKANAKYECPFCVIL